MTEDANHPLYAATQRLLKALDRLEQGMTRPAPGPATDTGQEQKVLAFQQENNELKKERENLNAAISQLENQYSDLHKVASTIYGKLDDSIKRLTQIIDE